MCCTRHFLSIWWIWAHSFPGVSMSLLGHSLIKWSHAYVVNTWVFHCLELLSLSVYGVKELYGATPWFNMFASHHKRIMTIVGTQLLHCVCQDIYCLHVFGRIQLQYTGRTVWSSISTCWLSIISPPILQLLCLLDLCVCNKDTTFLK